MLNNNFYVLFDKENMSDSPIFGICTSFEEAIESAKWLAEKMTEECFSTDPKESGLNREYDYEYILQECRNIIGIQTIKSLNSI